MQWGLGLVVAAACVTVGGAQDDLPWWRTATLYQVYPRSFKDSDGDGVGDLKGITQNAQYFKDIGVDAIWLSPIYKSPMVDFGYDISDFRDINPMFGTLDDFRDLVKKLRELDIKILLDLVPNHSSDQHPWFNKSLNRVDPYTDYYVWSDGKIDPQTQERVPPNNWLARFKGSAWEWREERQQYNLHLFTEQQIDFDFRNPAVVKEFDDVMLFWLDLGVDGFRMDAVIFLVEGDYTQDEPQYPNTSGQSWTDFNHTQILCQPQDFELQNHWSELIYNYSLRDGKDRAIFAEAYASDSCVFQLYGHGNTDFAVPFNFKLLEQGDEEKRAPQLRDIITGYLAELTQDQTPNWVIGNHDNIRMADRYGPEAVDAMCMLQAVLPGVKVVYYGEEIGMTNTFVRWDQTVDTGAIVLGPNHYLEQDRDLERTPMQWDASEPSAGFSTANETWLPVNPNYWWLNVDAQKKAQKSHLSVFKDASRIRKDPVMQRGKTYIYAPNNDTLYIVRSENSTVFLFIYNMGSTSLDYTTQNFFSPNSLDVSMSVEVVSSNSDVSKGTTLQKGSAALRLRPKAAVILRSPPSSSASSANSLLVLPVLLILGSMVHLFM